MTEGDTVEVVVDNQSDETTSIHWHGLHVPNEQDGRGRDPGADRARETYTYRFVAPHAGTFMYHAHGSEPGADRPGSLCAAHHRPAGPGPGAADEEYVLALQGWMVGMDGTDAAAR